MPNQFKPTRIRELLEGMSREPFADLLAEILAESPSPQSLSLLANKAPDRWYQAVTMAAKLAGYSEKSETLVTLGDLSDSELLARLAELEQANQGFIADNGDNRPL